MFITMTIRFFPTLVELRSFFKNAVPDQVLCRLSVDPMLCLKTCEDLNLNPRDLFQREIRPDRLLESVVSGTRVLQKVMRLSHGIHTYSATLLSNLFKAYPDVKLFIAREGGGRFIRLPNSIMEILELILDEGEKIRFKALGDGAEEVLDEIEFYNLHGWPKQALSLADRKVYFILYMTPAKIATEILRVMDEFKTDILSGIYHVRRRRLVVSRPNRRHLDIAKDVGWEDYLWTRLVFERRHGILKASFRTDEQIYEYVDGKPLIMAWLEPLFRGLPLK
jgi:phosphotransferase system HPr-like phosphotransfer protein